MLEKTSDGTRRALYHAAAEAHRRASESIGTDHLLRGLLEDPVPELSQLLDASSVDADVLVSTLEQRLPPPRQSADPSEVHDLVLEEGVKSVIEAAHVEATTLGHAVIGPEHLLLGLLRAEGSAAHESLEAVGLTVARAREQLSALRPLGSENDEPGERKDFETLPAGATGEIIAAALRLDEADRKHLLAELVASLPEPLAALDSLEDGWEKACDPGQPDHAEELDSLWAAAFNRLLEKRRKQGD